MNAEPIGLLPLSLAWMPARSKRQPRVPTNAERLAAFRMLRATEVGNSFQWNFPRKRA